MFWSGEDKTASGKGKGEQSSRDPRYPTNAASCAAGRGGKRGHNKVGLTLADRGEGEKARISRIA